MTEAKEMPNWPAAKLMDTVIGVDMHAVTPIPGIPVHPYFGRSICGTRPRSRR
jgi:hypothetical protein